MVFYSWIYIVPLPWAMLLFLTQYTTLVCISWWWLCVPVETFCYTFYINTDQCNSCNTWTAVSNLIQVATDELNRSMAIYLRFRQNYLHSSWLSNRIFSSPNVTSRRKRIKILTDLNCEAALSLARRSQAEVKQCLFPASQTTLPTPGRQGLNEGILLPMKLINLRQNITM